MSDAKAKVSERALLQRINRKLAHEGEKLHKARPFWDGNIGPFFNSNIGPFFNSNTGEYYQVDVSRNFIIDTDVDLESYGRELGVLGDNEAVAS